MGAAKHKPEYFDFNSQRVRPAQLYHTRLYTYADYGTVRPTRTEGHTITQLRPEPSCYLLFQVVHIYQQ